jgi:hypothetical protein
MAKPQCGDSSPPVVEVDLSTVAEMPDGQPASAQNIEHRTSNIEHRTSNIEPKSANGLSDALLCFGSTAWTCAAHSYT